MATSAQSGPVLRFDVFEVDLRSGELRKHGIRTRLQDQPFQVLRLLLERPGEVVTREELKQKLWPADTFVDFDDGLNTAVKKLRDTLGDSAERSKYIETLPRRGYRFIGTLEQVRTDVVEPAQADATRSPAPSVSKPRWQLRGGRRLWIGVGLPVTVALLLGSAWIYRSLLQTDVPSIRSVAVLPLENLSGDPAEDYFAAGLTDALTTELARAVGSSLRVTSRTSAASYKEKPLAQIASELDVDAVIEGSVLRSGDRARITAQLIYTRGDRHLWAASYNDVDLRDILKVQSEIAAAIARQVEIRLSPQEETRLAGAGQVDPKAYDLYQRGRYRAFSNNREDMTEAIGLLEQAVRLDPNLAAAHAVLARLYTNVAFFMKPQERDLQLKAIEAVNRALKLDPDLPDAHLVSGLLYWTHRNGFPHERAIVEIKRALELNPNLAEAHHQLATIYLHIGLLDKAEQELGTALDLDPMNTGVRYRIAITLLDQGKLEEALSRLEGTKRFSPELWHYQMALTLFKLGRKAEAATLIRDYLRDNPRDEGGVGNAMQALLYADSGESALAESSIQKAIEKGKDFGHFHHAAYAIGAAYAVINRPKDAVRWLRAAAEDGFPCYPFYENDTALQKLKRDAGFIELMSEMRSDWERRRATL